MKNKYFSKEIYFGIFIVALSTLMLELLLTRIFSATMWYHFAFMSVSLAMFGLSVGGLLIYLIPHKFPLEKISSHLTLISYLFSISIVLSFLAYLGIPFFFRLTFSGFMNLTSIYCVLSVPFFLSGLCISLILFHFFEKISKLYFFDLLGAGVGCFLIIFLLDLMDAPSAIIAVSLISLLASYSFSRRSTDNKGSKFIITTSFVLAILLFLNLGFKFIRIDFTKGGLEKPHEYEKWNTFSRITVSEYDDLYWESKEGNSVVKVGLKEVLIDSAAGTLISEYNGNPLMAEYLKYDVSNIGYYLIKDGEILIIGVGGGKDVLSALAFNQKKITGVEINPIFLDLVNKRYASFTGKIFENPKVEIVIDDGRSYLEKNTNKFDMIQITLTDTWAATAAGAFILSENNLYTMEAFTGYINHLKDNGVLSITRFLTDPPSQTFRMVSLAKATFEEMGIRDSENNIIVAEKFYFPLRIATVLIKKNPFNSEELLTIRDIAQKTDSIIVYSPDNKGENLFTEVLTTTDYNEFCKSYPYDISAPTDNRPFFFNMLRTKEILKSILGYGTLPDKKEYNLVAVMVLYSLLLIVIIFSLLFIFTPLLYFRKGDLKSEKGNKIFLIYFGCLGLGFMLVEISIMQRFILFLGHPIYSLAVILFSLLIYCGIGSYLSGFFNEEKTTRQLLAVLVILLIIMSIYLYFLPNLIYALIGYSSSLKIFISVLILLPIGIFLGMPFPLGIKIISKRSSKMVPWVWAINGATSVTGSVLAMVIAISSGFSSAFLIGQLAYVVAFLVILSFALTNRYSSL